MLAARGAPRPSLGLHTRRTLTSTSLKSSCGPELTVQSTAPRLGIRMRITSTWLSMAWKGPKASHSITGGGAHVLGWGVSMAPGAAGAPRGPRGGGQSEGNERKGGKGPGHPLGRAGGRGVKVSPVSLDRLRGGDHRN